jgi:hypothetical protein
MNKVERLSGSSGFRSLACGMAAVAISASLSWSFVASTASVHWLGSDRLAAAVAAVDQPVGASDLRGSRPA